MEEHEMTTMLSKFWKEVLHRRKLMEEYELGHIDEFNQITKDKPLPYIFIAIDEVAMLQDEKECITIIEKYQLSADRLVSFLC